MSWEFLGMVGDGMFTLGWIGLVALICWALFSPPTASEMDWLSKRARRLLKFAEALGAALLALCLIVFIVYFYWWTIRWLWTGLTEILPLP